MKLLVGISAIGMELMLSKHIGQSWVRLKSDVINWVEKEHKIMSEKEFFKQFMSEK